VSDAPPTNLARVKLFLDTVARYEEFSAAYPLPDSIKLGADRIAPDYWMRVMHGMLLRKYLASADHVYLPTVITSIETLMDTSDPQIADSWTSLRKMIEHTRTVGNFGILINGKSTYSHAVSIDELYGTLLHGDWERWQRSRDKPFADLALFNWVQDAWHLVFNVRGFWELGVAQGLVSA
jgi:hypothetical protein